MNAVEETATMPQIFQNDSSASVLGRDAMNAGEVVSTKRSGFGTMRTADNSTVERADLTVDRAEIESVWNRAFAVNPHRFQSYLTNPFGEGSIWVFRPESGEVRGAIGLHSLRMKVGEQVFDVGLIGNMAVDTEYRTVGPALRLKRAVLASLSGSDRALIFGVTEDTVQILRRAGCQEVGTAQRWVKVLRSETQLTKRMRSKWLAKMAAPLVDVGLRLLSRETFSSRSSGVITGIDQSFDSRFDRLWKRAAAQFPIATERSSTFLNWRFREFDSVPYQVFWLGTDQGEISGYIVFHVHQDASVEVVDVLYDSPLTMDRLLTEFLCRMRSKEFRATTVGLSYLGLPLLGDRLRAFGFRRRPESLQVLALANSSVLGEMSKSHIDLHRWFLTSAEFDM